MTGEQLAALELEHRLAKAEKTISEKDAKLQWHEKTLSEIKDSYAEARSQDADVILKLQKQLKEAENVIEFYADTNNWTESHSVVFTDIIKDSEWLKRTDEYGNNNVDWEVGGKRARAYLSKRKEV